MWFAPGLSAIVTLKWPSASGLRSMMSGPGMTLTVRRPSGTVTPRSSRLLFVTMRSVDGSGKRGIVPAFERRQELLADAGVGGGLLEGDAFALALRAQLLAEARHLPNLAASQRRRAHGWCGGRGPRARSDRSSRQSRSSLV